MGVGGCDRLPAIVSAIGVSLRCCCLIFVIPALPLVIPAQAGTTRGRRIYAGQQNDHESHEGSSRKQEKHNQLFHGVMVADPSFLRRQEPSFLRALSIIPALISVIPA